MTLGERIDVAKRISEIVWANFRSDDFPKVVGLSGPQGCGKSTAASYLEASSDGRIVALSLDDFYHTKSRRAEISQRISPLFQTRGPPGTHDIDLLRLKLKELCNIKSGSSVQLPVFSKTTDDRLPESEWKSVVARPRIILIEGWCIGAVATPDFVTSPPLNSVEERDRDGNWRRHQSECLKGIYSSLWSRFDHFIHLKPSNFDVVLRWRLQQEATTLKVALSNLPDERRSWVAEFIQYYERITRLMLSGKHEPGHTIHIDDARAVEPTS